jgi:hypothetical protein
MIQLELFNSIQSFKSLWAMKKYVQANERTLTNELRRLAEKKRAKQDRLVQYRLRHR